MLILISLGQLNLMGLLQKLYKAGVVEMANKGYHLKADAIPIVAAKSCTTIASNVSSQKPPLSY